MQKDSFSVCFLSFDAASSSENSSANSSLMRVDGFLAQVLPQFSREQLKRLIRAKSLMVDGKVCAVPSMRLRPQALLELNLAGDSAGDSDLGDEPRFLGLLPEGALDVVYEDQDLAVINKPADLSVHVGAGAPQATLVAQLRQRYGDGLALSGGLRPGIIHRLDKDTSGLMLVMRSDACYQLMLQDFSSKVARVYLALASGVVPRAVRWQHTIGRHPRNRLKFAATSTSRGKSALLWARRQACDVDGRYSLVFVRLGSGRTHQIRVQFAQASHHIVGDQLYGEQKSRAAHSRQLLHACALEFFHPIKKQRMAFFAPPPADFCQYLEGLNMAPDFDQLEARALEFARQQLDA